MSKLSCAYAYANCYWSGAGKTFSVNRVAKILSSIFLRLVPEQFSVFSSLLGTTHSPTVSVMFISSLFLHFFYHLLSAAPSVKTLNTHNFRRFIAPIVFLKQCRYLRFKLETHNIQPTKQINLICHTFVSVL